MLLHSWPQGLLFTDPPSESSAQGLNLWNLQSANNQTSSATNQLLKEVTQAVPSKRTRFWLILPRRLIYLCIMHKQYLHFDLFPCNNTVFTTCCSTPEVVKKIHWINPGVRWVENYAETDLQRQIPFIRNTFVWNKFSIIIMKMLMYISVICQWFTVKLSQTTYLVPTKTAIPAGQYPLRCYYC